MARSVGLVDGDGDPDFTIIALGSRMQWENRVTADVGRNRLFRRGLRLHQLLVVVERSLHDLVDDVVGQILVCDREIVEPDRRVVALLSRIGSGRDQRLEISGNFWRIVAIWSGEGRTKSTGCVAINVVSTGTGKPVAKTAPSKSPACNCAAMLSIAPNRMEAL